MKLIAASLLGLLASPAFAMDFQTNAAEPVQGGATYLAVTASGLSRSVEIQSVVFDEKNCTLIVSDHPPGQPETLPALVKRTGAIAGINASYFHPDFTPLGLVMSNGEVIHKQETAKLLSGILAVTRDRLFLMRSSKFKLGRKTREAVQAGPFLVYDSASSVGLDSGRWARRSFIASLGKGRLQSVPQVP